jgi:hypothetical protein
MIDLGIKLLRGFISEAEIIQRQMGCKDDHGIRIGKELEDNRKEQKERTGLRTNRPFQGNRRPIRNLNQVSPKYICTELLLKQASRFLMTINSDYA